MRKKAIHVTDEQLRQRGGECGTISAEEWLAMTLTQQEELVKIRESTVSGAGYRVFKNEEAAGIRDKMEELRSRKTANEEAIRDLYFGIPDDALRIKAINDLFHYKTIRKRHDASLLQEAYFPYGNVRKQLIFGWQTWPEFKNMVRLMVVLNVVAFAARLIWPSFKATSDLFIGISVAWSIGYGMYWDLYLRQRESHYFLLWQIEKMRQGILNSDLQPALPRYELFGERERKSGVRSVPREIRW